MVADAALPVGRGTKLHRRFNLLETTTAFLRVETPGDYIVSVSVSGDAEADIRIEPSIRPPRYQPQAARPSGATWSLDEGFYTLHLAPREDARGIVELELDGPPGDGAPIDPPRRLVVRFASVHLSGILPSENGFGNQPATGGAHERRAARATNRVGAGLSVLARHQGECRVRGDGAGSRQLDRAIAHGTVLPVAIDGAAAAAAPAVEPGTHRVGVTNSGDAPLYALVRFVLPPQPSDPELPPLPPAALATLPKFPRLAESGPSFLAVAR